uniref:Transposase n=1 Tax=Ditylenchus dipsaci TaxID=166011 RepID=A0A915EAL5_9BILA
MLTAFLKRHDVSRRSSFYEQSKPSVSSSAKKRKRDSIWEKFRNLHKDGIDYVQCIECPEVIYKSTVPASTLKYHWEESKNHKSVAVITSVGDDPGAKKLTKLEQIDRAFTKVLSVPSMPINAFLHPDMRSFIDLLNRDFKLPKRVTLHFVKDSQLRTAFLGLRCLHGAHTAINIRQEVIRVLEVYGLTLDEIFKVVTDNGSNILSAFADVFELPNELPCYEYDEDDL